MPTNTAKNRTREVVLILHDIRSAYNVGSIFRTADGAGVAKIFCAGYTPTPKDVFGKIQNDIRKTALGAEETVPWETRKNTPTLIRRLQKDGYQVIAIEQDPKAVSYTKMPVSKKVAFVLGNETGGISKSILKLVDGIAEIPMKGSKESLNVSVAAGVALFRMLGC